MENEEISFDEFIAASSDEGYQTGSEEAEVTEEATETGNVPPEGESSQQSGEEPENEEQDGSEENGAEGSEKPDSGTEQKFTIKVNKEEKEVSLEEMTALAQKGADYDRIKERDAKSQQTIQDLQAQIDSFTAK